MGTRAITKVVNSDGDVLVNMYRQSDGCQDVHGMELKELIAPLKLVNGTGCGDVSNLANGMDCLAATIVSKFKTKIGGIYLNAISDDSWDVDYEYTVYPLNDSETSPICIKCMSGFSDKTVYYDGLISEYPAED